MWLIGFAGPATPYCKPVLWQRTGLIKVRLGEDVWKELCCLQVHKTPLEGFEYNGGRDPGGSHIWGGLLALPLTSLINLGDFLTSDSLFMKWE